MYEKGLKNVQKGAQIAPNTPPTEIHGTHPQHILECLNSPLTMTICLRVISSVEVQLSTQLLMKHMSKPRSEAHITVDTTETGTLWQATISHIYADQFLVRRTLPNGKKIGTIGHLVH